MKERHNDRIEEFELNLSHENTKITTAKQPLTEKTRTYKIDILHPKTKKQPQWDSRRGTFTTESNLIPARLETHKLENNLPGSPT